MKGEKNNNDPVIQEIADQFDTLQKIVDELRLGKYSNDEGPLDSNAAFLKLEQLARAEEPADLPMESNDLLYEDDQSADEPFHIEADIYDSGDYANLLVIPSAGTYIVVGNDEHLATLVKSCEDSECWDQVEGSLDEEIVEMLGNEISNYIGSR